MDKDETQMKSALEFRKAISNAVHLPVLTSGEAGTLEHYAEGVGTGALSYFGFSLPDFKFQ